MKWTAFQPIEVLETFPKKLREKLAALNEDIANALQNRKEFDAKRRQVSEGSDVNDIATHDFTNDLGVNATRTWLVELLQNELRLRREIQPVLPDLLQALRDSNERQKQELTDAKEEVRKGLVKVGYLDGPPAHGKLGTIQPGWIDRHPRVRALTDESNALQHKVWDFSYRRDNAAAMEQLESTLQDLRKKLTEL